MEQDDRRISTAGVAAKDNRYFVVKRLPGTSIGESWEFPGGKNRLGELPQDTVKREFLEELSLEITVREQIFQGVFSNKDKQYILQAFSIEIQNESEMTLHEHSDFAWLPLDRLLTIPMADSDRQIVHHLLDVCTES